jgi:hypothetical protein
MTEKKVFTNKKDWVEATLCRMATLFDILVAVEHELRITLMGRAASLNPHVSHKRWESALDEVMKRGRDEAQKRFDKQKGKK